MSSRPSWFSWWIPGQHGLHSEFQGSRKFQRRVGFTILPIFLLSQLLPPAAACVSLLRLHCLCPWPLYFRRYEPYPERFDRLAHTTQMVHLDGFSSLIYQVLDKQKFLLHSKLTVDVGTPLKQSWEMTRNLLGYVLLSWLAASPCSPLFQRPRWTEFFPHSLVQDLMFDSVKTVNLHGFLDKATVLPNVSGNTENVEAAKLRNGWEVHLHEWCHVSGWCCVSAWQVGDAAGF